MRDAVRVVVALEPRELALEVIDFLDRSGRVRVVATAEDADALVREVRRARPGAVVAGPGLLGGAGGAEALGATNVLAVAPEETLSVLKQSFEVGAKGFFRWPTERDALVETAARIPSGSEPSPTEPGRVVAVYGPRGGVGTTFLASHLSAVYARQGLRTSLVDAGALFGDLTTALGVPPEDPPRTIAELLPLVDELADEQLVAAMWRHPAGFAVLLAPRNSTRHPAVSPMHMRRAVGLVAARSDVVVIDVPRSIDALARAALEGADRILVLLSLDLLAFAAARRAMDVLASLGLSERCAFVVNRARRASLAAQDVPEVFDAPAIAVIGEDRSVPRLQDLGRLLQPRGSTFRRIDALGRRVLRDLGVVEAGTGPGAPRADSEGRGGGGVSVVGHESEGFAQTRRRVHRRLLDRAHRLGLEALGEAERRLRVREEALAILREEGAVLSQQSLARLVNQVSDQVVGLGPIESLLKDPEVSEIMVNGPAAVFVERRGLGIERVPDGLFEGEEAVLHLIERIVAPLGLRVDESSPWVDARLPDGSRVHAIVRPLSLCGPVLTIRKFSLLPLSADDLVATGTVGPRMLGFLEACVRGRANIVVSGGTSSGKTTLLNVLSSFIPADERLITIEDAAELRLAQPHVVRLEARPPNVEGRGEVTVRELVRNALRMRPDRIIVGEVRGPEALDMLQAMNTGHEGSISTAHANSPRHLLWRLETMALMSDVGLPADHVREQTASAVDLVVQMGRLRGGRRVVLSIAAVEGLRDGRPEVVELFAFRRQESGFVATGRGSTRLEALRERGARVDPWLLEDGPDGALAAPALERVVVTAG